MAIATKSPVETITAKNPVRNAFAGCSSGNGYNTYYDSKGSAVSAFDAVLAVYGYHLDCNDLCAFYGNEGRRVIDVYNDCEKVVGCAVLTWFRMESGRYEFVGYLA